MQKWPYTLQFSQVNSSLILRYVITFLLILLLLLGKKNELQSQLMSI